MSSEPDPSDLSEQELLIELNKQLATTNHLLEQLVNGDDDDTERYRCLACGTRVVADRRRHHLEAEHNAPPDHPLEGEFEAV